MKIAQIIFIFLILSGCTADRAEMLSFGIVENVTIEMETNKNLVSGNKHIIESWNVVKSTTVIPNEMGIDFGIAYKIASPFYRASSEIEEVMVFPGNGLTNPDTGQSAKSDSEKMIVNSSEDQYFSYTFDSPWEAKSGKWLFQVKQDDVMLLEQAFDVQPKSF